MDEREKLNYFIMFILGMIGGWLTGRGIRYHDFSLIVCGVLTVVVGIIVALHLEGGKNDNS